MTWSGWLNSERQPVRWVRDGRSALTELHRITPEVPIIASRLPVLDAVEVCRRVRCWSDLPIIVLGSDRGIDADVEACIAALEAGADDYIKPPVHEREFMARVRAAARRSGPSSSSHVIRVGDLELYPREYRAVLLGTHFSMRPQEFRLLLLMARERGAIVSGERLLDLAWRRDIGMGSLRTLLTRVAYSYRSAVMGSSWEAFRAG